jgi:hypothetical protein
MRKPFVVVVAAASVSIEIKTVAGVKTGFFSIVLPLFPSMIGAGEPGG